MELGQDKVHVGLAGDSQSWHTIGTQNNLGRPQWTP